MSSTQVGRFSLPHLRPNSTPLHNSFMDLHEGVSASAGGRKKGAARSPRGIMPIVLSLIWLSALCDRLHLLTLLQATPFSYPLAPVAICCNAIGLHRMHHKAFTAVPDGLATLVVVDAIHPWARAQRAN